MAESLPTGDPLEEETPQQTRYRTPVPGPQGPPTAHDRALMLRYALTQWTLEPLNAPRTDIGLTHWAELTMHLAGELCTALGVLDPFFSEPD